MASYSDYVPLHFVIRKATSLTPAELFVVNGSKKYSLGITGTNEREVLRSLMHRCAPTDEARIEADETNGTTYP